MSPGQFGLRLPIHGASATMHHCKGSRPLIGRNFTVGSICGFLILLSGPVLADSFPRMTRTDPPAVLVRMSPERMGRRVDLASARTRLAGALEELQVQAIEAPYEEV